MLQSQDLESGFAENLWLKVSGQMSRQNPMLAKGCRSVVLSIYKSSVSKMASDKIALVK